MTLTRQGSKDPVTDQVTWGDWSTANYPEVKSPFVKGYTPDQATVAEASATSDKDVTVTYTKNDVVPSTNSGKETGALSNSVTTVTASAESGNSSLTGQNANATINKTGNQSAESASSTRAQTLPQTGNQNTKLSVVGALMLGMLSLLGIEKRKSND